MPLLNELLTTVSEIGHEATTKALTNARNKSVSLSSNPKIDIIINTVLQELSISFEQLTTKNTRTTKKRHGLIIACYCLRRLKISPHAIGVLLKRHRSQVTRYHKTMINTKSVGALGKYKIQFDQLVSTLITKKSKTNGTRRNK